MLKYLGVFFMAVLIQCAPETDPSYQGGLSPSPTAYVKEFGSVSMNYKYKYITKMRLFKIMINNNVTDESYTINVNCETEDAVDWMVYFYSCSDYNVTWTILNVTQENHGDMWTVTQFQGDDESYLIEEEAALYWSEVTTVTPFLTTTTLPTTIFVKGYIQATTVFADDDDKMTVEVLVTKRYPDGDRLFLDIKAKSKNESEASSIPGSEAAAANHADGNGLFAVMWKSTANLTHGQYTYDITFTRIVIASPANGTFCVGCAYGQASMLRMELSWHIFGVTVLLWSENLF